jgi:hypothetical protein
MNNLWGLNLPYPLKIWTKHRLCNSEINNAIIPDQLLFRQIYLDTAQLADIVMEMPEVDENRVGAIGSSQGGGLTLACASLEPRIKRLAPLFPFLCDYKSVWEMDLTNAIVNINNEILPYKTFDGWKSVSLCPETEYTKNLTSSLVSGCIKLGSTVVQIDNLPTIGVLACSVLQHVIHQKQRNNRKDHILHQQKYIQHILNPYICSKTSSFRIWLYGSQLQIQGYYKCLGYFRDILFSLSNNRSYYNKAIKLWC